MPVLAAGGIMTGRQMAGCMAMGAAGVWTGSVWLATTEAETSPMFREKMVAARSRDTVRSRGRTGKPARQLRSAWTDAWEGPDSPGPLPMPLQGMISEPAMARVNRAAEAGNAQARELVSYFVGQGVGLVDGIPSCRQVVAAFMTEFAEALDDMQRLSEDSERETDMAKRLSEVERRSWERRMPTLDPSARPGRDPAGVQVRRFQRGMGLHGAGCAAGGKIRSPPGLVECVEYGADRVDHA